MSKLVKIFVVLYSLNAAAMAVAADAAAGKSKAATCSTCHGPDGISISSEWPNLAGQNFRYLVKQITAFREGDRTNVLMAPMVNNLSDQDIQDIAAYYSSKSIKQPAVPAPDAIGRNHVAVCVSCHGLSGLTVSPEWPNLAGQQEAYLVNQLKALRDGTRVDPVMTQMAVPLSDKAITEIATYYYNLR